MNPERDISNIRFAGSMIFGLGLSLVVISALVVSVALFSAQALTPTQFSKGFSSLMVTLIMASFMLGCGAQLQHVRPYSHIGIQDMRLIWTALFVAMVVLGVIAWSVIPPMAGISVLVLLILIVIRGAVIRLTR